MIPAFIEIAKILGEVAPTLASAFLSPAAGIALKLVAGAIPELSNNADPNQLLDHLKSSDYHWSDIIKSLEYNYAPIIKPLLAGKWPKSIEMTIKLNWGDD